MEFGGWTLLLRAIGESGDGNTAHCAPHCAPRVLSLNVRTGLYAVALDDGKELSLKAECVALAGCVAAGCASEETSSVCS